MNTFLDIADRQISAPVKARRRAVDRRAQERLDKEVVERGRLLRAWLRWQHEQLDEALAGPDGAQIAALIAFLETLTLEREAELVDFVQARAWNPDIRFIALRLIGGAIVKLRERAGLPPFNDALPGEPLTVFQQVRGLLQ